MQSTERQLLSVCFAILLLTSVVSAIQIKPAFSSHGNQTQLTFTINPSKDSFLRKGDSNTNEGANDELIIQGSGLKRILAEFDQDEINEKFVNGRTLQSATLRLYIADNANNWGTDGRIINAHRLLSDWTEGNGWNDGNNIRGTGSGVTWNCSTDTDISNPAANCNPQWDGGTFESTATSSVLITNGMTAQWVQFGVTQDVQAFLDGTATNHGWIIKKIIDSQSGQVGFASKESGSNIPQLVLVVNLSQGEILFNQYSDLISELGSISNISDESVVADYLADSITKLKTDTQNIVTDENARQNLISILDSALQSASNAGSSVLALDESGANLKITNSRTFVDSYASEIALHSGTTIPTADADLLISKANQISSDSLKRGTDASNLVTDNPLTITSQIIDQAKLDVVASREIVTELKSLGFTVDITVQRNSPAEVHITFSSTSTSQVFEIIPSNDTLAASMTVGILEQAPSEGIMLSQQDAAALSLVAPAMTNETAISEDLVNSTIFLIGLTCAFSDVDKCITLGIAGILTLIILNTQIERMVLRPLPGLASNAIVHLLFAISPPKLIVNKNVINDNGGILQPRNFTIHVSGAGANPEVFLGVSEGDGGMEIKFNTTGSYTVNEDPVQGYTSNKTGDCSGNIDTDDFGLTKTCTIINDDNPPASVTLNPTDDSWTHSSEPNRNLDGQGLIVKFHFDGFAGKDNRKTWLKFDLPVPPSQIKNATLRMFLQGFEFPGSIVDVYRHNNNNWLEETITFNNEPAKFAFLSAGPFASKSLSTVNQYHEFNVTNAIICSPSGQTVTLVLVGNSLNNGAGFADKENLGATPPELEITKGTAAPCVSSMAAQGTPLGPYFYLEMNQTSVNATKPDSVTIPLRVNWQEGYEAEPVSVTPIAVNMTGISYLVTSTYNSTTYQLFDIVFDIPAEEQAGEYPFFISVTEADTEDRAGQLIVLNVE